MRSQNGDQNVVEFGTHYSLPHRSIVYLSRHLVSTKKRHKLLKPINQLTLAFDRCYHLAEGGGTQEDWATPAQFDRIHAPIGIDIQSKTVQEIAVSIAAQLILVRRQEQDNPGDGALFWELHINDKKGGLKYGKAEEWR